jgi:hypothetical protein
MSRVLSGVLVSSLALVGCAVDAEEPPAEGQASILPRPPHCVAPWGIDWSQTLGVTDAEIVSPFCTHVTTGNAVIPEALWITNTATGTPDEPITYPSDYVPASPAPMTDFLHKLARVRYVVQREGLSFELAAPAIEKQVTVNDLFKGSDQFPASEATFPVTALLGKLPPLDFGGHTIEIHFVMTAAHCDGHGTNRADSCLPAGDTLVLTRSLTVSN